MTQFWWTRFICVYLSLCSSMHSFFCFLVWNSFGGNKCRKIALSTKCINFFHFCLSMALTTIQYYQNFNLNKNVVSWININDVFCIHRALYFFFCTKLKCSYFFTYKLQCNQMLKYHCYSSHNIVLMLLWV